MPPTRICPPFRSALLLLLSLLLLLAPSRVTASEPRSEPSPAPSGQDGHRFDPGISMATRAPSAPPELDQARFLLGTWQVQQTVGSGEQAQTSSCEAEITYLNRGHGLAERLHCDTFLSEQPFDALAFLVYNSAGQVWMLGEADSFTESARLLHGSLDGEGASAALTLTHAVRRGGGPQLRHYRLTWRPTPVSGDAEAPAGLEQVVEASTDDGSSWQPVRTRRYVPSDAVPSDAVPSDAPEPATTSAMNFGAPSPNRAPEGGQFDFLIGRWNKQQEITLPNGQVAKFSANGTAVHALGGHAILEFLSYDIDPNLPDAANTVLRVYNRALRRWENLFLSNRNNSVLHFGGAQEGEGVDREIVLHPFDVDASGNLSFYIFHDIRDGAYEWHSKTSTDRGATFNKTWIISARRVEPPVPEASTPTSGATAP